MRKIAILVVAAMALLAVSAAGIYAQPIPTTIQLNEQNGSGESGTATLTDMGNGQTHVVVTLSNAPAVTQPGATRSGGRPATDRQVPWHTINPFRNRPGTTCRQR